MLDILNAKTDLQVDTESVLTDPPSTSMADDYDSMTNSELRNRLGTRQIALTGLKKKDDLIERLRQADRAQRPAASDSQARKRRKLRGSMFDGGHAPIHKEIPGSTKTGASGGTAIQPPTLTTQAVAPEAAKAGPKKTSLTTENSSQIPQRPDYAAMAPQELDQILRNYDISLLQDRNAAIELLDEKILKEYEGQPYRDWPTYYLVQEGLGRNICDPNEAGEYEDDDREDLIADLERTDAI